MGKAFEEFLVYISEWFGTYDEVHGVAVPFVSLIQGLIDALGTWFVSGS
jgi:hypothetical protein